MEEVNKLLMQRALELAALGRGTVSPNPMVGCVIFKNGKIIGEGWHREYGQAHAEVNAINSVKDKAELEGAELYVTLEPCAHFGKTPPCADLIVQFPFKKVFIANIDPFKSVNGMGIEKLLSHGIQVETGILEKEGKELNKRFFTSIEKERPYIILKWAETSDGFIAREDFTSKWISGEFSRLLVHKWRSEEDAILVGTSTAKYDDPGLNVREWQGRNPLRVVVDKVLKLERTLKIFDNNQSTLILNEIKNDKSLLNEWIRIDFKNTVNEILKVLNEKKIQSLIVEGGAKILQSFIQSNFWDEARIFKSKNLFNQGIKAPEIGGIVENRQCIGDDELTWLVNR